MIFIKIRKPAQRAGFVLISAALAVLVAICALISPAFVQAAPYRSQEPEAAIGAVKIKLSGPAAFPRIDGRDRNLDDILLATQSPAAAILSIYAEPGAWKKFQNSKSGDENGLNCHALISTPAPMAGQSLSLADFSKIKKDLSHNLKSSVKQERRLEKDLASVSDHQVEKAVGRLDSFAVLSEGDNFITYIQESSLEMKLKGRSKPRISRSISVTSTMLLEGKIINLQLTADSQGPARAKLESIAELWRDEFTKANR